MSHFRLNDFEIQRPAIGSGGFGEVFVARPKHPHLGLPEKIALKKVKRGVPEVKIRNECEIMRQIQHAGVVKLYGDFKENGDHYLVMELCQHGDLRKYVKEKGPMENIAAAKVLKQLIGAVRYWHKKDIMHRDLSAGNILIERLPSATHVDPIVKVTDFGLARELHKRPAQTFAGTPGYMPPEMQNGEEYNEAADVYALGVLLYFMLTGDEPREGMPLLHTLDHDAKRLIASMTVPQEERCPITQICDSQFMKNCGIIDMGTRDRSVSRDRSACRSRERSIPSHGGYSRRESSQSRERRPDAWNQLYPVVQPERRAARPEIRPQTQSRTEPRSRSRADSGIQSAGRHNTVRAYCPGSVANGFSIRWPVPTIRLAPKKTCADSMRMMIDEEGNVTHEVAVQGDVTDVVKIRFEGGRQVLETYKPIVRTRLPAAEQPPVAVDGRSRRAYTKLEQLPAEARDLYKKSCYALWQMSRELPRVEIAHPIFPWALVRLMENGDLRIVPTRDHPHLDKFLRKRTMKGGIETVSYRRMPTAGSPSDITDPEIIRKIEFAFKRALHLEQLALEDGCNFPIKFLENRSNPNGPERRRDEGRPVRGRSSSVSGYASVASAPSQFCEPRRPLREMQQAPSSSRVPSRSDVIASASYRTNEPRSAPYQSQPTAYSRVPSRCDVIPSTSSHLNDPRLPLHQPTSSRTASFDYDEYDIQQLDTEGKREGYFSVVHRATGRYLRMSTAPGVWDMAIYKTHRGLPDSDGYRFRFTDPRQVPREAVDLAEKLESVRRHYERTKKPEAVRSDSHLRHPQI